jgi:hypothetical protein
MMAECFQIFRPGPGRECRGDSNGYSDDQQSQAKLSRARFGQALVGAWDNIPQHKPGAEGKDSHADNLECVDSTRGG